MARDPWRRMMIGQPRRFAAWVPEEVRSEILRGLPDGLNRFGTSDGPEILVWVHRSGGFADHQLYRYFPEDLSFYLEKTKDPAAARILRDSMRQWNRMMGFLVEERGMSPNEAREEIRRTDDAVFRAVLEGAALFFAAAAAPGSLGPRGSVTKASRRPVHADAAPVTPPRSTFNPFKGKTPAQVDEMFRNKGFEPRGPDPLVGKGGYVNTQTGRSYYLDPGGKYKRGIEHPHVDVNRPKGSMLSKRKFPLGDLLTSKE